jgi:hypothetical protein
MAATLSDSARAKLRRDRSASPRLIRIADVVSPRCRIDSYAAIPFARSRPGPMMK